MAKEIEGYLKLQVPAGQANPSPPIGPALGQRGLNIMEFSKAFNDADAVLIMTEWEEYKNLMQQKMKFLEHLYQLL